MSSPSMVHCTGDKLVVRSVFQPSPPPLEEAPAEAAAEENVEEDPDLPQCKIKRNYTCTHCTYFTQNPRLYLYHLKDIHKEKIRIYECPKCLYASKHSQKLQRHVHMVHVMGKGKQKSTNSSKKAAAKALKLEQQKLQQQQQQQQQQQHLEELKLPSDPSDGEEITCTMCSYTSRSKALVARHEQIMHLRKKFFRCAKCNYVTHLRARYTKHVKYHSMPMIKCDLCDFRTPYKWNLDRHYKNHNSDGIFKCSICNFTADIKQSLTVHEMNHHVPPAGQPTPLGGGGARRRNKVGGSDLELPEEQFAPEDLDFMQIEPDRIQCNYKFPGQEFHPALMNSSNTRQFNAPKLKINPLRRSPKTISHQEQDFIHPDDIIHKNGNVYIKKLKCQKCNFKAVWQAEITRHEFKVHNIGSAPSFAKSGSKKAPRPIPNLIPIQNKGPPGAPSVPANLPILKIPSVRGRSGSVAKSSQLPEQNLSEKDLNEICAKSCATSSLKDFASVIGGEEAFRTADDKSVEMSEDGDTQIEENADTRESSPIPKTDGATAFKKKNASFFDQLKEKLVGGGESLVCKLCGYESKCLSESVRHQKSHSIKQEGHNQAVVCGAELSSTRCQRCRQRCKTSADLIVHLQTCGMKGDEMDVDISDLKSDQDCLDDITSQNVEVKSEPDYFQKSDICESGENIEDSNEEVNTNFVKFEMMQVKDSSSQNGIDMSEEVKSNSEEMSNPDSKTEEPHPMENKVFVWNSLPDPEDVDMEADSERIQEMPANPSEEDSQDISIHSEGSLIGVETAPGYGTVTSTLPENSTTNRDPEKNAKSPVVKKVFKCPHCIFWASTASRFHVHIVGHLNKKPFECSLCSYRSNWRWDITKHIRLKAARDSAHKGARVLMTDETGRRNYSKYNKYLTMMTVGEPSAESSGSGKRSVIKSELGPPTMVPLPAPPKLIRAPTPSTTMPTSQIPLRPPPPLRHFPGTAVQRHVKDMEETMSLSRPTNVVFDENQELKFPLKRPSTESKKTLWKCKKCNYRDANRDFVLAHVKEHYQHRSQALQSHNSEVAEASVTRGPAPFQCGHCHQVSNWKHVIQRHCRLKHSGDVKILTNQKEDATTMLGEQKEDQDSKSFISVQEGSMSCEMCPFITNKENLLANHMEKHISRSDAFYKCYLCPYFVSDKSDLLEHIQLHGINDMDDSYSKILPNNMKGASTPTKQIDDGIEMSPNSSIDGNTTKRYKCVGCPYVSNSKSQFLYHKQFHRPRGAPFKCGLCSYNVSRRHLLHQHLRVHGILIPPQKSPSKSRDSTDVDEEGHIEESEDISSPPLRLSLQSALDTEHFPTIPLVWVSRGSTFLKMFKCRFCPHVNVRKANIQEHEKMHRDRTKSSSLVHSTYKDGIVKEVEVQQHKCPDCNYVCNNAGVLSSHAKVHQGLYGQVHCLVDSSRSDEAQLQELNASINESANNKSFAIHQFEDGNDIEETHDSSMDLSNLGYQPVTKEKNKSFEKSIDEYSDNGEKEIYFCNQCPARFLFEKELNIHKRFHTVRLAHRCESCSYTSRKRAYLLSHLQVHTDLYQEKTNQLIEAYATSVRHPKPKTAVIVEGSGVSGPIWVVVNPDVQMNQEQRLDSGLQDECMSESAPSKPVHKQFACKLCPARFFKTVALQYHESLHGGNGSYKCRHCDYSVKTYGNLVKHEMIHGEGLAKETMKLTSPSKVKHNAGSVPLSGTDLFQQKSEAEKNADSKPSKITEPPPLHVDPQFGILMHGNPDFIYPTYMKNGRVKEKRYKCHKCPSAFEKREQYKVHLSLHGSKQRYRCEKCDYSVKYYANYIQHVRKHQKNDEERALRNEDKSVAERGSSSLADFEFKMESPHLSNVQASSISAMKTTSPRKNGPISLTAAEQQMLIIQRKREGSLSSQRETAIEQLRKNFWCPHCPYFNQRRDALESHLKRHIAVSNLENNYTCSYCDYSVPQSHFLREHVKLHFNNSKRFPPEAYMLCDKMEIWVREEVDENNSCEGSSKTEENSKILIFQDRGEQFDGEERFLPPLPPSIADLFKIKPNEKMIIIDPATGEPVCDNPETRNEEKDAEMSEKCRESSENKSGVIGVNADEFESHLADDGTKSEELKDNCVDESETFNEECSEGSSDHLSSDGAETNCDEDSRDFSDAQTSEAIISNTETN